jgi:hypothetical protein
VQSNRIGSKTAKAKEELKSDMDFCIGQTTPSTSKKVAERGLRFSAISHGFCATKFESLRRQPRWCRNQHAALTFLCRLAGTNIQKLKLTTLRSLTM